MDLNNRKMTNNPPSPDEEGKKEERIWKEVKRFPKEKKSPDGLNYPNQYTIIIIIIIICQYFVRDGKIR